jgi:hypothetical protein
MLYRQLDWSDKPGKVMMSKDFKYPFKRKKESIIHNVVDPIVVKNGKVVSGIKQLNSAFAFNGLLKVDII